MALETLFWASAALVIYVYAVYPAVVALLARWGARPARAPIEPRVSLLVAAYNEAEVIEQKIRNALALEYPPERLEIVIASDGSTDGTAAIAEKFADGRRVRVFAYPRNRGKITVLNETIPHLRGEIVVFSDASSMAAPDALRQLVACFADPHVGAASGVYKVRKKEQTQLGAQEDFYWKYETFLKMREAALGSVLGAHGSLYAIRRELYPFPAPGTINDDYVIPVRIVQRGYRVAYEPAAVAYEEAHEMGGFGRRVRIMAGNIQQLREVGPLLFPLRPLELWFFLSHKAGRVLVPWCMLAVLLASVLLAGRSLYYGYVLTAQAAFYGLALAGASRRWSPRSLRLPYYFCMINAAAFLAFYRSLAPARRGAWK